jgi:hypothetical protein
MHHVLGQYNALRANAVCFQTLSLRTNSPHEAEYGGANSKGN